MRRASYSEIENKIWNQQWFASGDSAFTDTVWDKMRVLPTDPGESAGMLVCSLPGVRMRSGSSKGPTLEGPPMMLHHPIPFLAELRWSGEQCFMSMRTQMSMSA